MANSNKRWHWRRDGLKIDQLAPFLRGGRYRHYSSAEVGERRCDDWLRQLSVPSLPGKTNDHESDTNEAHAENSFDAVKIVITSKGKIDPLLTQIVHGMSNSENQSSFVKNR